MYPTASPSLRRVQSCITSIGFPRRLEALLTMVEPRHDRAPWQTDLEALLQWDPDGMGYWTAPNWLTEGDILFFYHIQTAAQRIALLRREVEQMPERPAWIELFLPRKRRRRKLLALLDRCRGFAERYGGTLLACARVSGPAERFLDDGGESHYRSQLYVPFQDLHIFEVPLPVSRLVALRIKRQGTITPLDRWAFDEIKLRLAEQNALPDLLADATFGETGFYNVDSTNWPAVACSTDAHFLREDQLRAYFLDFLLDELKDPRTPLLQECRCVRDGQLTGLADYYIRLHGVWVPVEAKLNVLAERDLPTQVRQYIHIDTFTPTKGARKDEAFQADDTSLCLVVDQQGVYLTSDGAFRGCAPGEPIWQREGLTHERVQDIRDQLRAIYSE